MTREEMERIQQSQLPQPSPGRPYSEPMSASTPQPKEPNAVDEAFVTLRRYGFAVLFIENAPPVVLIDPERVLMAVLK